MRYFFLLFVLVAACDSTGTLGENPDTPSEEVTYRITSPTPFEMVVGYTVGLNEPSVANVQATSPWEARVPDFDGLKAVQFATASAADSVTLEILRGSEVLQQTVFAPTSDGRMYHGTFAGLRVYPLDGHITSAGEGDVVVEVNGEPKFQNPWPGEVHSDVNYVLFAGDTLRVARTKTTHSILSLHTMLSGSAMHLASLNHDQGPWEGTWVFGHVY
ncbi:MAG: hypothetical protein JJ896_15905 [Rhodothermales bacterium]|nr:hypothetical protein [Rhodothermales bacterium]